MVMMNGDAYVENYFNNGDAPIVWPGFMDTTELALWTAYEATKDDILIIDQLGGSPPTVVEAWMGSEQIYPSQEAGKEILLEALNAHLPLP